MPKLTKTFIDKVQPPAKGEKIHWDDTVKGYGLRVIQPVGCRGPIPRRKEKAAAPMETGRLT